MPRGRLSPTLSLSLGEAERHLRALTETNVADMRHGRAPRDIIERLTPDHRGRRRIRYLGHDPREVWLSARELAARGAGDCEDLACAVAAQRIVEGMPAWPIITMSRRLPNVGHVVVQQADGFVLDPSILGGMR